MIVLGIESTAHTFGVGLVNEKGEILANFRDMYRPPKGWGIDPKEARKHHEEVADQLINKALEIARPDLIAFSAGPGLPPALVVGKQKAIELAKKFNTKIVEVNHCIAHIEIGRLTTGAKNPVVLYVSGGNTQVIGFENGRYRVFGETEDISIGNLIDVFAREVGLSMPGGPEIEKLAKEGKNYIMLPYSVKGMDVSFSGMLTALKKLKDKYPLPDLAYSLQETAFAMLIEVTERAMAHLNADGLIVVGGVAANQRFNEMARIMCEERGAKFYQIPKEVAGDNGVMIAWTGYLMKENAKEPEKVDIYPRWRTDEVEINYR